jgi:hypothetical protein
MTYEKGTYGWLEMQLNAIGGRIGSDLHRLENAQAEVERLANALRRRPRTGEVDKETQAQAAQAAEGVTKAYASLIGPCSKHHYLCEQC